MALPDLHENLPGDAEPKDKTGKAAPPDKTSCLKEINGLSLAEVRNSVTAMRGNAAETTPTKVPEGARKDDAKEGVKLPLEIKTNDKKSEKPISIAPGDKRAQKLLNVLDKLLPWARPDLSKEELIKERAKIRTEVLKDRQIGPATKLALAACTKLENARTTAAARNLLDRGIPILDSPISVPLNKETNAPVTNDRYRSMIVTGKLSMNLALELDKNANAAKVFEHVDNLQKVSNWISGYALPRLETAHINTAVEGYRQRVSFLDTRSGLDEKTKLADWLPKEQSSKEELLDWKNKADPWLEAAEQAVAYRKAIDSLDRASKSGNQWCVSRWGSESFNQVIGIADFPGDVQRDSSGNITHISLDLPHSLDRTQENIATTERLNAWVDKVSGPVKQAINEFTLDNAKQDRVCMWADQPVEGLLASGEQYNSIRQRFHTEEVTVQVIGQDGKTHAEPRIKLTTSEQHLWVPDYSYHGLGAYNVGEAKASGFASVNGVNLEPNREYSLGPTGDIKFGEISLPQNKINLQVNSQGQLQIYDYGNNDEGAAFLTQADGGAKQRVATNQWVTIAPGDKISIGKNDLPFENDVRLYKPDDWVTVANNTGLQIMQAKDLNAWATEAAVWHEGGKVASIAMDVGMVISGTIELKAAKFVGEKGLATATEKALATMAEKAAMRKNGLWHLGLGLSGPFSQFVENEGNSLGNQLGIGHIGTWANTARSMAMTFDIAASNLPSKGLKSWWGAKIGEAHPESMKAFLDSSTAAKIVDAANKPFLVGAELEMLPDIIYNKLVLSTRDKYLNSDPLANANAASDMLDAEQVAHYAVMPPAEKLAEDLIKISDRQTQSVIENSLIAVGQFRASLRETGDLRIGTPEYDKALEPEAERLARFYTNKSERPEQKVAAIIGLLRLKQRPDGSLPEVLATLKDGTKVHSLTLEDAQKALLQFRPIHDAKAKIETAGEGFKDCTRVIAGQVSNADLLIKRTNEFLAPDPAELQKPEFAQLRKDHMDTLAVMYRFGQSDADKLAAGLGLLMLNREANGAIPQQIGDTIGWNTTMLQFYNNSLPASNEASFYKQGEPKEDPITSSEVITLLKSQLGGFIPAQSKLAIADTLYRLQQLSTTELGGICQEIVKDKNASASDRIQAILDGDHSRLATLLGTQRFEIEETLWSLANKAGKAQIAEESTGRNFNTMQESLLSVVRNNSEEADVRALALSALQIGNIVDPLKRKAEIATLKEQWLSCGDSTTHFAQIVSANLKARLSFLEKPEAPNTPEARAQRFQSSLSLYELQNAGTLGIDKTDQKIALNNLLSCLAPEKTTKVADILESSYMAAQAVPILAKNIDLLTKEQKSEFRNKTIDFLSSKPTATANQAKVEAKKVILNNLDRIFSDGDHTTQGALATGLKQAAINEIFHLRTSSTNANGSELNITQTEEMIINLAAVGKRVKPDDTAKFFQELAKNTNNPAIARAAAIEGLCTVQPSNLSIILADIAGHEADPELLSRIRASERLLTKLDPNAAEYKSDYETAKADLFSSTHGVNLTLAEKYIARHLPTLTAYDFSNGRQSKRLAGEIKEGEVKAGLQAIVESAKKDDGAEARNALAYILLSNGRPFLDSNREEAVITAAEGLYHVCKDGSLKTKINSAPLIELAMSGQPLMPREARRLLLNGVTWLYPGETNGALSKERAATAISLGLEQEIKNTPARAFFDGDFEEGKKLQLDMLSVLSRYAGDAQIPLLVAMSGNESPRPITERDTDGYPKRIIYPDNSSLAIIRDGDKVISLSYLVPDDKDKSEIWSKEQDKDVYFSNKDPKKENPATERYLIDRNGRFTIESSQAADGNASVSSFGKLSFSLSDISISVSEKSHPLEEVRASARQLIADLKENTQAVRSGIRLNPSEKPSEQARSLERTISSDKANSEDVVKAIFQAGLNTRIADTSDPRRQILVDLLKNPHERIRLAAAHVLLENSDCLPDRQGAALVFADLAYTASLAGYRQDALQTMQKMNKQLSTGKDSLEDPVIKTAFRVAAAKEPSETILNNESLIALRELSAKTNNSIIGETPETVRIDAATRLIESSSLADQDTAIKTIAWVAKNGSPVAKDKAWAYIDHLQKGGANASSQYAKLRSAMDSTPFENSTVSRLVIRQDKPYDLERYEAARLQVEERSLRQFKHMDTWFKRSGDYNMLDGNAFSLDETLEAQSERGLGWLIGLSPDYERVARKYNLIAKDQFNSLVSTARQESNEGKEARTALAYIVLSDGRPLRSEADRSALVNQAAEAIARLCRSHSPGGREMLAIVEQGLIAQPSLSTETRTVLFEAIKYLTLPENDMNKAVHRLGRHFIDENKAAQIVAQALQTEYRSMPQLSLQSKSKQYDGISVAGQQLEIEQNERAFKSSEKLQLSMLDYLEKSKYAGNMAQLQALANHSKSEAIQKKAKTLVQLFKAQQSLNQ